MQIVATVYVEEGTIVRPVAGKGSVYRPLASRFIKGSQPQVVGRALVEQLGLKDAYVRDLTAIRGGQPDWTTYSTLIDCGLNLWIDAGLVQLATDRRMIEFMRERPEVTGLIAASSSLPDTVAFHDFLDAVGPQRSIFRLDLYDGRPIARARDWQDMIAAEIGASAIGKGVTRLMLMDRAHIGMQGGCRSKRLCRVMRRRFPGVAVYSGGGVRGMEDVHDLAGRGCAATIVSSAIHEGWIGADDIKELYGQAKLPAPEGGTEPTNS